MNDPAAARAVLADRARALARPVEMEVSGDELDGLRFSVGEESFVIEARFLREVVGLQQLVRVPGAPAAVRGVTRQRGEILAVVDLLAALGRPGRGLSDLRWMIVVGETAAEFGLLADDVAGVSRLRADGLRPLPEGSPAALRRLARGTGADAALLLDGAALLRDAELFASPHRAAAAPPVPEQEGDLP